MAWRKLTEMSREKYKGVSFMVYVTNHGRFVAQFAGDGGIDGNEEVEDVTLDGLTAKVHRLVGQAQSTIAIPVTLIRGTVTHDCVLRGMHGRTRKLLLKNEQGKFDIDIYSARRDLLNRLTSDEHAEFNRLAEALNEAETAHRTFVEAHLADFEQLLRDAGLEV